MTLRPALRFATFPLPPAVFAARFFAAVIRPQVSVTLHDLHRVNVGHAEHEVASDCVKARLRFVVFTLLGRREDSSEMVGPSA